MSTPVEPVAVIGMACRFPEADNLEAFWSLIRDGGAAFGELPPDRLDRDLFFDPTPGVLGRTYTSIGGFIPERPFDGSRLAISDETIALSDPVHLTMLEVAADACRHANLDPRSLPIRRAGVYIGHARASLLGGELICDRHIDALAAHVERVASLSTRIGERSRLLSAEFAHRARRRLRGSGASGTPFVGAHDVAALVAEGLGLCGPYMAVDAACASSMLALSLAAGSLRQGQIEMAVVGGASYTSWPSLVAFSSAQALSEGHSCPFDERASGFVSSDGFAALLLKTLSRALADGDPIHAVIRGIGISTDGRGKSLWAPRSEGQVTAIRRGYGPGLDPGTVQYVEAHGTSTRLGDRTELESLTEAFRDHTAPGRRIPITSVKANLGHTRETAGMAGLIKTVLAMREGIVPAAAGFRTPASDVDWSRIPFFVPTEALEWRPHDPSGLRRAAVNSFGIGGLNAHVVLDSVPVDGLGAVAVPRSPLAVNDESRPRKAAGRVAVVGIGTVLPGAHDLKAYRAALATASDPRREPPDDRWDPALTESVGTGQRGGPPIGAFVTGFEYDWKRHRVPPRQVETADPLQFMLLDAAEQALGDAGFTAKEYDRARTAVVVGTVFGGDFNTQLQVALRVPELQRDLRSALIDEGIEQELVEALVASFGTSVLDRYPALRDETGSYTSSTLASRIARTFDLMGGALAVDAGEASSLAALDTAVRMLRAGDCDLVLCAGAQRWLDITCFDTYGRLGGTAVKSHSLDADPAEGAVVLALKRLEDAERDNDPIRAVLREIGVAADSNDRSAAVREAVADALARSDNAIDAVAAVEISAPAGSAAGDLEVDGVTAAYRAASVPLPSIRCSATSRGHALGASGMVSLIGVVEALGVGGSRFEGSARRGPLVGGVTATEMRGLAYHALLEPRCRTVPAVTAAPFVDQRIVRLGAPDIDRLIAKVTTARESVTSVYESAADREFSPQDRARLAIVVDSPAALGPRLAAVEECLRSGRGRQPLEDQGVFFHTAGTNRPRVALVFSGQGSQYPGMLQSLVAQHPAAAAALAESDELMCRMGHPDFREIAWGEAEGLGRDVWRTQVSLLLGDGFVHAVLRAMGVRPDVVCGHSYGEYAALVAADVWSLEQAVRVTRARCDLIERDTRTAGSLLATAASAELIEELLTECAGRIHAANFNSPDQTILGGMRPDVEAASVWLEARGARSTVLPVPRPFHTPLMAGVQVPFADVLARESIRPPSVPFLSSVDNRYVAEPSRIRRNLVRQLTRPVRYLDLVRKLADDGVTVFVEVGPKQVLTKLHRRNLSEADALAVATDHASRGGLAQLLCVTAALDVAGVRTTPGGRLAPNGAIVARSTAVGNGDILHFDATKRRRENARERARRGPVPEPESTSASAPEVAARADVDEPVGVDDPLGGLLTDFVCEQTGYPADLVDLDADLEADLGIDSIKKAQLIGEMTERFEFPESGPSRAELLRMTTLRQILEVLRTASARQGAESPARATEVKAREKLLHAVRPEPVDPSTAMKAAAEVLSIVRCGGTAREMGRQHAVAQAAAIRAGVARYGLWLESSHRHAAPAPGSILDHMAETYPAAFDELTSIAETLDLELESVAAWNGVLADFAAGCSQFAVRAAENGTEGMIHAVNEDCPLDLILPGAMRRIVQVREPAGGIPNLCFGVGGQVGGLNGFNASGVTVTSTMLLDRDWAGAEHSVWMHFFLMRSILDQATDLEHAVSIVCAAPRGGAWSVCLSHHPSDEIRYLEYQDSAIRLDGAVQRVTSTNHSILGWSTIAAPEHSLRRLARLRALVGEEPEMPITIESAQEYLRDRFDIARDRRTAHATMNTLRRVDNQASIVIHPAAGVAWVTHTESNDAAEMVYHRLSLPELLLSSPDSRPATAAPRNDGPASNDGTGSIDLTPTVMRRFALRAVEAPTMLDAGDPDVDGTGHGPALIVGDSRAAGELRKRLQAAGETSFLLESASAEDEPSAVIGKLWERGPIPRLYLLSALDQAAAVHPGSPDWRARLESGPLYSYRVCQDWLRRVDAAGLARDATLVVVTALGGDFGFGAGVDRPEGGGIAGLAKAIRREFPELRVRIVDVDPNESPECTAACLIRETRRRSGPAEIAYLKGRPFVVRAIAREAENSRELARGGCWLVSGGARGVTAYVARRLGRLLDLDLHIVGRTPRPRVDPEIRRSAVEDRALLRRRIAERARSAGRDPLTAWRDLERDLEIDANLGSMAADGLRVTYHACDVADREALARVLADVRARSGPIQGVIHGAGIESASRFERKRLEEVRRGLMAKVDGAAALMELTSNDPLRYFVAFGSISGRFGGLGQTDYSMASEMLCKLVQQFRARRPECRAVGFHWPAWDEVGMAARPESRIALESAGQRFMPLDEGFDHLVQELMCAEPEGEVLVVDHNDALDLDGILERKDDSSVPRLDAGGTMSFPLLIFDRDAHSAGEIDATATLDPVADPFLRGHRFDGVPLLPAAVSLELLAEAARAAVGGGENGICLRNIRVRDGVRFHSDEARSLRVRARLLGDRVQCRIGQTLRTRDGSVLDADREHLTGIVKLSCGTTSGGAPDRMPTLAWESYHYADEREASLIRTVFHGPELRCLRSVVFDGERAWGRIAAPDPREVGGARPEGWIVPTAAFDACLVLCGAYCRTVLDTWQLPLAFETIQLVDHPRAGEECLAIARYIGRDGDRLRFDFELFGADRRILVACAGHERIALRRDERGSESTPGSRVEPRAGAGANHPPSLITP